MHFIIVFSLALLLAAGACGLWFSFLFNMSSKLKTVILPVCATALALGIIGLVSMSHAINNAEITKTTEDVYDIDKLTTSTVYYTNDDDQIAMPLSESYISVEQSSNQHNIVIKTTEYRTVNWLINFEHVSADYVVYLDEYTYTRYQNKNVIYERGSN